MNQFDFTFCLSERFYYISNIINNFIKKYLDDDPLHQLKAELARG